MDSRQSLQQMVLGKLGRYMQKNETRSPIYTIHKNILKIDIGLKHKMGNHKNTRGIHRQQNL